MFREQYKPAGYCSLPAAERATETCSDFKALLRQKRALSEVDLAHPELPFLGVLDRVQLTKEGVEVVDFKTGKPKEKHRMQLLRYALLWWRRTGDVPSRISAQYLDGVESWPVTQEALENVESELVRKLPLLNAAIASRPAGAKPGAACHLCEVRARCAEGWAFAEETALLHGRGDVELAVEKGGWDHGFVARSRTGVEIAVVYQHLVARLLPERTDGLVLRVLDGVWVRTCSQLEIKAWTEVYVVTRQASAY
jgi:hypothetical protein